MNGLIDLNELIEKKSNECDKVFELDLLYTGTNLRNIRKLVLKKNGIDFCKEYKHISNATLSKIENGRVIPPLQLLKYVSNRSGIPIDQILVFKEIKEIKEK